MPGREPSKYWKEIGLDPPSIFPAKEIWLHTPGDDDEVLDDLLHNYDNRQSMVFVRGEPSRPLSGALPKVLRQLKIPDERQTLSAFNIRSSVLSMKIPEVISARYPPDSAENTVEVNITPRGAVVDLHFDPLSHGITGWLY
ncbi:hypothetical protein KJ359_001728 [Pestalotiopsis sp. 9143b]|nr:hypothetical protein KJ359_001728 [Pestalotiopsis sp. 9143b]